MKALPFAKLLLGSLVLLLVVGVAGADAKTFYVKSWDRGGRNNKTGESWSNAVFSVSVALNKCSPGDTVLVEPGIYYYANTEVLSKSGDSSKRIKIKVANRPVNGNNKAIFDGSLGSSEVFRITGRYLTIDGNNGVEYHAFVVRNARYNGIKVAGRNGSQPHHITINNVDVRGSTYSGIVASRGREQASASTTGGVPYAIRINRSNVTNNCRINADRRGSSAWPGAVAIFQAVDVYIDDTNIYKNYGEGALFMGSDRVGVEDSYVSDNYSANVYFDNTINGWCGRNVILSYDRNFWRPNANLGANGVVIANEQQFYTLNPFRPSRNIYVQNNQIEKAGYGFWFWRDFGGNAITVQQNSNKLTNTTVSGNAFKNCGQNTKVDVNGSGNSVQ